jgi:hypothetical protein
MSIVASLKLITNSKKQTLSPILQKRSKLLAKIQEQLDLCEAQRNGEIYAPKKFKTVTNKESGERVKVETIKRVKEWFWIAENGKINLAIKYGAKTVSLNKKGANAIELTNGTELVGTLHKLKEAVENGELDEAIAEVSNATRKGFKR